MCKVQETLEVINALWSWLFSDCMNVYFIHDDALIADHVFQESDSGVSNIHTWP